MLSGTRRRLVCHQVGSCCPSKFSFCRPPSGRISTNIDCCVTWWPIMIVRLVSTDSRFYKPILPTTLLLLLLTKQSTSIRSTSSIPVVEIQRRRHQTSIMSSKTSRAEFHLFFVFFSCWLNMKNESIILWRVSSHSGPVANSTMPLQVVFGMSLHLIIDVVRQPLAIFLN